MQSSNCFVCNQVNRIFQSIAWNQSFAPVIYFPPRIFCLHDSTSLSEAILTTHFETDPTQLPYLNSSSCYKSDPKANISLQMQVLSPAHRLSVNFPLLHFLCLLKNKRSNIKNSREIIWLSVLNHVFIIQLHFNSNCVTLIAN